ncbi:MAG: YkgJ family cysteine cluster protein [Deltaproteobacteria bacterium]|nr:MAG: YkgJ family cysteine cluster protein [Deltaproteobacteria bacterium]
MIPLSTKDTFIFHCHPEISCFNECCRDLNQFLYPYDILRLTGHLKLHSSQFLKQYTSCHTGPSTGLPMMTLRPLAGIERICPFVSDEGCTVYPNRPASCRIYPLARAISRNRQTGRIQERFALLKEPHCRGRTGKKAWTAGQWMKNQQLDEYNRMNDQMISLISLKNQHAERSLSRKTARMFYLACYDLDRFREQILYHGLADDMEPSPDTRARITEDDLFLLEFGMNWIKQALRAELAAQPTRRDR